MKRSVLALMFLAAGLLAVAAWAADKSTKSESAKEAKLVCPVSGKAATKDVAVDYKGGKVYMCCPGCCGPFEKDTAKFAAKANEQLVASGQAKQVACPFSGKPLNAETALDVDGNKVAFCCNGCKGKVAKASKAEQVEMVFGKNFDKGFKVAGK